MTRSTNNKKDKKKKKKKKKEEAPLATASKKIAGGLKYVDGTNLILISDVD